jgi:hypothetical protein
MTNMPDISDGNRVDYTICSLVADAITLEKNYKEMLLQGDEVDRRIKLWRDVINICMVDSKGMPYMPV